MFSPVGILATILDVVVATKPLRGVQSDDYFVVVLSEKNSAAINDRLSRGLITLVNDNHVDKYHKENLAFVYYMFFVFLFLSFFFFFFFFFFFEK